MLDLRIGTSGYDYPEWKGPFYPPDTRREDFLDYYLSRFDTLELNSSYYRVPSEGLIKRLTDPARRKLDLTIKAHQSLTHAVDPHGWRQAALKFTKAITPVAESGQLVTLLLQFPYRFHYTPENRQYLGQLTDELHAFPLTVEFRHPEWLQERVYTGLLERGIAFCNVDAPPLKDVPHSPDRVTANLAYLRFHGRNKEAWWTGDATTRFDYRYTEAELTEWVERILAMSRRAGKTRIYFNNHWGGKAAENARQLQALLEPLLEE